MWSFAPVSSLQTVQSIDKFEQNLALNSFETLTLDGVWTLQLEMQGNHLQSCLLRVLSPIGHNYQQNQNLQLVDLSEFSDLIEINFLISEKIFNVQLSENNFFIHCRCNPTKRRFFKKGFWKDCLCLEGLMKISLLESPYSCTPKE